MGLLDQNLREGPRSGRVILTSEGYDFQSVRISEDLPTVGPALVSLLLGRGGWFLLCSCTLVNTSTIYNILMLNGFLKMSQVPLLGKYYLEINLEATFF